MRSGFKSRSHHFLEQVHSCSLPLPTCVTWESSPYEKQSESSVRRTLCVAEIEGRKFPPSGLRKEIHLLKSDRQSQQRYRRKSQKGYHSVQAYQPGCQKFCARDRHRSSVTGIVWYQQVVMLDWRWRSKTDAQISVQLYESSRSNPDLDFGCHFLILTESFFLEILTG